MCPAHLLPFPPGGCGGHLKQTHAGRHAPTWACLYNELQCHFLSGIWIKRQREKRLLFSLFPWRFSFVKSRILLHGGSGGIKDVELGMSIDIEDKEKGKEGLLQWRTKVLQSTWCQVIAHWEGWIPCTQKQSSVSLNHMAREWHLQSRRHEI